MPSRSVRPDLQLAIDQELPRLAQSIKNLFRYGYGKLRILAAVRKALMEVKLEDAVHTPGTGTPTA